MNILLAHPPGVHIFVVVSVMGHQDGEKKAIIVELDLEEPDDTGF